MTFLLRYFSYITLFILLWGCGNFFTSNRYEKSERYKFIINSQEWDEVEPDLSDHAYENNKSGSHIFINTLCKKYESNSLDQLSQNMLKGIPNIKIKRTETTLHNRNAITIDGKGDLDGVPFNFKSITFKRNRCTYDFVLVNSKTESFQDEESQLKKIIESLVFEKD